MTIEHDLIQIEDTLECRIEHEHPIWNSFHRISSAIKTLIGENLKLRLALYDLANDHYTGEMASDRARHDIIEVLESYDLIFIPQYKLEEELHEAS